MKYLNIILVFLCGTLPFATGSANSSPSHTEIRTLQTPELIIYEKDTSVMIVQHRAFSPLENYYKQVDIEYPFEPWSTANWRGFTGYWKVVDGELLLYDIFVPGKKELTINDLFPESEEEIIKADWFTGFIHITDDFIEESRLLRIKPIIRMTDEPYNVIELQNGNVINSYTLDSNTWLSVCANNKKLDGLEAKLAQKLSLYAKGKKKWKEIVVE